MRYTNPRLLYFTYFTLLNLKVDNHFTTIKVLAYKIFYSSNCRKISLETLLTD